VRRLLAWDAAGATVVAMALAACGPASSSAAPTSVAPAELTIFAAASLRDAIDEAAEAYEAANPGMTLIVSVDSSAALATQIEQGAPADVLLSADLDAPQRLIDGGFASGEPIVFAGNRLTIIVPSDNPAGIESAADLANDGVRIVAAGDDVPITSYARDAVAGLATLPGFPAGFEDDYAANVVTREDNVRAVVAKIELGEGDAAIVYVTDAGSSSRVVEVELPDAANVTATYAGVVVKASPNGPAATAFLEWLAGPGGWEILAGHGFVPPE
jgi:molybdate transport system substrate-binding protein